MTLRVMLVDDNEDDLFFTRLALKRSGDQLEVTSFDRAQDALDWLQTEQGRDLHLILLDINMPSMNGFEFLEAFSRLPEQMRGDTAIVMVSSSSDPKDKAGAFAFPVVQGYFIKPLSRKDAARLVNMVLPDNT